MEEVIFLLKLAVATGATLYWADWELSRYLDKRFKRYQAELEQALEEVQKESLEPISSKLEIISTFQDNLSKASDSLAGAIEHLERALELNEQRLEELEAFRKDFQTLKRT